ncbi:MAG TPA: acryloyl-CoA reductase [Rubricoccaceae bacterium]|jgi:acrylyl-CoA reductase (NADPH)
MRALVLHGSPDSPDARVETLDAPLLPGGSVRVAVSHSSLNYKDGLAVTGAGKIIRGAFPFVPGIDAAGTVLDSDSPDWTPGDAAILTGWGTGETQWGGFADTVAARPEHLVRVPAGWTPERTMAFGTAGLTAALALVAVRRGGIERGAVVVTGASGGVGSVAVGLFAHAGFEVTAVSGTPDAHAGLVALGAAHVVGREALGPGPALAKGQWDAAVDTVGGEPLARILATTNRHGVVAACGNAASADLHTTVFPFILRGVTLAGIDSNTATAEQRTAAWALLAEADAAGAFESLAMSTISLADVPAWAARIVRGETVGRVVVDVRA